MEIDKSRFKDIRGVYRTQSLFHETALDPEFKTYTLMGKDIVWKGKTLPSLKRLYLDCADTTEYIFANTYLFDYDHWKKICGNKRILEYINNWRYELELKLKAEGLLQLRALAKSGNREASTFFANGKWSEAASKNKRSKDVNEEVEKLSSHESAHILKLVRDTKNG